MKTALCPHCGGTFVNRTGSDAHPAYRSHLRRCQKASTEQRAFFSRIGRWPQPKDDLSSQRARFRARG